MTRYPIDAIIDPLSGAPAWGEIDPHRPLKAAFALKAAQGLIISQLTIDGIEQAIIGAANKLLRRRGRQNRQFDEAGSGRGKAVLPKCGSKKRSDMSGSLPEDELESFT